MPFRYLLVKSSDNIIQNNDEKQSIVNDDKFKIGFTKANGFKVVQNC